MSYNYRNPTLSFRVDRKEKNHLDRVAEKKKMTVNDLAKDILTKYLKGELVSKKDDHQLELIKLKIEKLKLENKYLQIKCDFADNFHAPISQSASHFLKPKPMIINETQSQEFQSAYDASNHRLQCVDCGILFKSDNLNDFMKHVSSDIFFLYLGFFIFIPVL